MTNYNKRLDKALDERLAVAGRGWGVSESVQIESMSSELDEAKQAILDWHNKQTLELLDRLLHEYELDVDSKWFSSSGGMVDLASAIEAERNKLKR